VRLRAIPGGFRVRAPAKLNLYLEVLGDRPDGYHEIESIFHAITGEGEAGELRDELEVTASPAAPAAIDFASDDPALPGCRDNLAYRAAEILMARARPGSGLRIRLRKGIPVGAGLGGGSSDAAAVLLAGSRVLGLDDRPEALAADAASLGSDVPFFLHGGTAVVKGRGEIVEPIALSGALHFVVVVPAVFVSTKAVYDALPPGLTRPPGRPKIVLEALERRSMRDVRVCLFNRLEPAIHEAFPEIHALQSRLRALARTDFRITGSGSGLFTITEDRKEAVALAKTLSRSGLRSTWIASSEPE
jgi:4-diphosphocytidyl-2-C-methyl-D-erythritol kinase